MKDSGGNKEKGADFGRGTKTMKEKKYEDILAGEAPSIKSDSGKAVITDKTS